MHGFEEWFSGGVLPARYVIDALLGIMFATCVVVMMAAGKYLNE